jgi:hypothetical protein
MQLASHNPLPPCRLQQPQPTLTGQQAAAMIAQLVIAFEGTFGRAPGAGDPLLWDPDVPVPARLTPRRLAEIMAQVATAMGADPAAVAAVKQTGMLPPRPGGDYTRAELAAFNAARRRHQRRQQPPRLWPRISDPSPTAVPTTASRTKPSS